MYLCMYTSWGTLILINEQLEWWPPQHWKTPWSESLTQMHESWRSQVGLSVISCYYSMHGSFCVSCQIRQRFLVEQIKSAWACVCHSIRVSHNKLCQTVRTASVCTHTQQKPASSSSCSEWGIVDSYVWILEKEKSSPVTEFFISGQDKESLNQIVNRYTKSGKLTCMPS